MKWDSLPDGTEGTMAWGRDQAYLITWNPQAVVLTRWNRELTRWDRTLAQVALNAITVPAADGPSRMAALAGFRETAAQYEAGLDIDGQPAWTR